MRWWVRRVKEETQRPQFSPKKERVPRLWWCAYHQVARGRGRQVQEAVVIGRSMVLDIGGVGHSVQGKTVLLVCAHEWVPTTHLFGLV